ncbi:DNA-processing protein DprA [Microbacterium sp. Marseille-Q6965]|uniref:DNA-processing protein DprA n=1 Tax=Microbacterium sp. Marseille-Q6965 TaxID=2965072 RepID=UPI0021B7EBBA|nr:DNA-processing protein DprA [Microbacterium sp. Marseille-Q6965]
MSGILRERAVRDAAARMWPRADVAERRARVARAAWSILAEPGDGAAGRLVAALGPVDALCAVGRAEQAAPGFDPAAWRSAIARWRPRLAEGARLVATALEAAQRRGLALLVPEDEGAWPRQLGDLGDHAPAALWVRGDVGALLGLERSAAIVGARAASGYGEHVATEIAGDLAADGIPVVSGAAYGIDGAAHRAALREGGPTVAVLAGGADRVYPAGHTHLLASIAESGAVVSEVAPGTPPTKFRFLMRNRLIAALAGATVVVEAGWFSGSLNTASHAASLGRPLGAVPGSIVSATSAGCHRLLREFDAVCVTGSADVKELLGLGPPGDRGVGDAREDPTVTRVADALGTRTWRTADEVALGSGVAVAEVEGVLGMLALEGRAQRDGATWRLAR